MLASAVHADNQPLLDFLISEIRRVGVEVRRGHRLTPDEIAGLGAEALVLATGGRLVTPKIPGDELPHVFSGEALRRLLAGEVAGEVGGGLPLWQRVVLRGLGGGLARFVGPNSIRRLTRIWMPLARRVVIVGGDLASIELTEFLAERGRSVCVVERQGEIAPEVGAKRRGEHMDRLDRLAVSVLVGLGVERITRREVRLDNGRGLVADSVIVAGAIAEDRRLAEALRGRVPELHEIGDCTGLGLIRKATEEAARVACAL